MASKVNTKFVVILGGVVVALAVGVGALAYSVLHKSPAELSASGDKLLAAGDFEGAARQYSKAVNKEQTNPEWLRKWRDALVRITPETLTDHQSRYEKEYLATLRQLAIIETSSLETQRAYLDALYQQFSDVNASRTSWESLAQEADGAITRMSADPQGKADPKLDTLKRYRGIARLRAFLQGGDVQEAVVEAAQADVRAALAADPADAEASFYLESALIERSRLADTRGNTDERDRFEKEAVDHVTVFASANPASPMAQLSLLAVEFERLRRRTVGADRPDSKAFRESVGAMTPRLLAIDGMIRDAGAAALTVPVFGRFQQLESIASPTGRTPMASALMQWAAEQQPDNSDFLLILAGLRSDEGKFDDAIELLKQQTELPERPISWAGLKQKLLVQQAEATAARVAVRKADGLKDPEAREAALKQAQEWRDRLAGRVPADAPPLLLIDGELKAMRNDWQGAKVLLTQYNTVTSNTDHEGLLRLAVVHMNVAEPGDAKRRLERVLQMRPGDTRAMMMLAEVELQLRNFERSASIYAELAKIDPDNATIQRRLAELQTALGQRESDDPVLRDLIAASRKADGDDKTPSDLAGAVTDLRAAAERHKHDPRIVMELVRRLNESKDRPGALEAVRKGMAARPENKDLAAVEKALSETDDVNAQIALVRAGESAEPEKQRAIFELLAQAGRRDEAEALFAKMVEEYPEEGWVIETRFVRALSANKIPEARELADKAAAKNLDRVQGRTFYARVRAQEGAVGDAVIMLQQGVDNAAATPEYWRLLGRLQVASGRPIDAVPAFQRAVEMRPTDLTLVKDLLTVLTQVDRRADALAVARGAERSAANDRDFFEMLMTLEQQVGDKQRVVSLRERLRARDAGNRQNNLGLASVLMDLKQFEKARVVIDELRKTADGLDAVLADFRWHSDRAEYTKARQVFGEYLVGLQDRDALLGGYITYAQTAFGNGDLTTAYVALLQARRYQSPERLEGEKALGDFLIQNGRWPEAVEPFQKIVNAKADDDRLTYTKRLIEALTRAKRFAEARGILDGIGAAAVEKDVVLLLLSAEVAAASGDRENQRRILDRAIQLFPAEPMCYLKRAQMAQGYPELVPQAIEDLTAALKINPAHWQSLQLRGNIHMSQGDLEQAIADLRGAARANPRLDDVRDELLQLLIDLRRKDEAVQVADEAVAARPNDLSLFVALGDRFSQARLWAESVKYYEPVWEQTKETKNPNAAQKLLDGLLLQQPPVLGQAEAILRELGSETVERNPGLLMARAKLAMARGRVADAEKDCTTAMRLINPSELDSMRAWFSETRRIFPETPQQVRLYTQLQEASQPHREWMILCRATVLSQDIRDKAAPGRAIQLIDSTLPQVTTPLMRQLLLALKSNTLYYEGRYEDLVKATEAGLKEFPNNPELANNLAFTLAKHLNRPQDALPLATEASKANPDSAEIMDTLGFIQLRLGELAEAQQTLTRAGQLAKTKPAQMAVAIHAAMLAVQQKDKDRAQKLLKEAERIIQSAPFLESDEVKADLESIRKDLGTL
jgi:tetratricopeptide (TPR) repeat protein